jgi:addiction module HigA family antidote
MTIDRKGPAAWAVHPGEVLREDFMKPMALSSYALAKALHVPPPRIHDVVLERRAVSPDTALRLARYFSTTPELWLGLQVAFDLAQARKQAKKDVSKIRPRKSSAA